MAAIALLQFGPARGAPGDIFEVPAPVIGADPPKARDLKDGDASVATQTGALGYTYPIEVPPGRNGMRPSLALSYSSQAPLHGGVAAGWSLSVPEIREDTSGGRLRTRSPLHELEQGSQVAPLDDRFVSSMAGGRPLVRVGEPVAADVLASYRAQSDTSFLRYERMKSGQPYRWRALATDGITLYFGHAAQTTGCQDVVGDGFAPLTRTVDVFGNEVVYEYAMASGECMLDRITYGQNAVAGLPMFAEVRIHHVPAPQCSGAEVGAKIDYRSGVRIVTGANKITSIAVNAFAPGVLAGPVHTRTITLGYSAAAESCTAPHSAVRLLTSIQESAVGNDAPPVTLPAVTFTYGDPTAALGTTITTSGSPWVDGPARPDDNLSWGLRLGGTLWPTVEAMMIDLDGDGLLDRLVNGGSISHTNPTCRAVWQRGLPTSGGGQSLSFDGPAPVTFGGGAEMPMLRWKDPSQTLFGPQGCALNGQFTQFHNSHYTGGCHDGSPCTAGTYCPDGNICPGNNGADPITYLAYRWLDMDGDGLTDLVAGVHGSTDVYDIIRGNDLVNGQPIGFEPPLFGTVPIPEGLPSCSGAPNRCIKLGNDCMSPTRNCDTGNLPCHYDLPAIDACEAAAPEFRCEAHFGFLLGANSNPPDIQSPPGWVPGHRYAYRLCNDRFPWFIFKNLGNGAFSDTPVIKLQPIPLESDYGDSSLFGAPSGQTQGTVDIDGDGLLDAVVQARGQGLGHPWWWYVWLNDGTGGFGPTRYVWFARDHSVGHISASAISPAGPIVSTMGLFDVNSDGLPDHWLANPGQPSANVAYNVGTRFELRPGMFSAFTTNRQPGTESTALNVVKLGPRIRSGDRYATRHVFDVDADGRPDLIEKPSGTAAPAVRFNQAASSRRPRRRPTIRGCCSGSVPTTSAATCGGRPRPI